MFTSVSFTYAFEPYFAKISTRASWNRWSTSICARGSWLVNPHVARMVIGLLVGGGSERLVTAQHD